MSLTLTSEQLSAIATIPDRWDTFTPEQQQIIVAQLKAAVYGKDGFPVRYRNRDTGKVYNPHNLAEQLAVFSDSPRYTLIKGGEGGGKTVSGAVKCLNRLRRGMNGFMLSPSLPHFKRSAWSEFVRWCPREAVIDKHQERLDAAWEPREPFRLVFKTGAVLECAGIVNPGSLEGPNLNFAWFDEARHFPDGSAIKVLDGRVRIPGPNGETPQIFLTTTPKMNWLFEYFGPIRCECPTDGEIYLDTSIRADFNGILPHFEPKCPLCGQICEITDEFAAFKLDSLVVTLLTSENVANLQSDFVEKRAQTLTEAEARVLLDAEWEDIEAAQPFLPTMLWWDNAATKVPQLSKTEPMIIALDAATGRTATDSDCFAILGVTRHWDSEKADTHLGVRFYKTWRARAGQAIDFEGTEDNPGPERVLRWLCENYNILMVTYDPTELHDMAQRLSREGLAWFNEFSQSGLRYEADRELLTLIQEGRIAHDGSQELREHLRNADRKMDSTEKKLRIVKRSSARVIDLAICLSMASFHALRLSL